MLLAGPARAEPIRVQATVSRTRVPLNSRIELRLQIQGTQQVPPPTFDVPGFDIQFLGPSTQVSIVNGVVSSSVTHLYVLLPRQEGRFTIAPITLIIDGKSYATEPIEVEVVAAAAAPRGQPPGLSEADAGQTLQLELSVEKSRVYLNEPIRGRLQLLISGVAVRGIELPSLTADGFLVKPVREPTQSDVVIGGAPHTLLSFDVTAIPIRAGTLELGPASIVCQVAARRRSARTGAGHDPFQDLFGDSFFDDVFGNVRTRPVELRAKPVIIEVLPLPEEARPADFGGAVGRFTMEVAAVPTQVAAGEPVTLTMTIEGSGNFDTVTAPALGGDLRHFKVYDPQPSKADEQEGQRKIFEQVVIPLDPGVVQVPPVRFSYFDPHAGRYETIAKGPIALTVTPSASPQGVRIVDQAGAAGAALQAQPEVLGRDLIYIKEALGPIRRAGAPWHASARVWALLLAPWAMLAAGHAWRRWRLKIAADPSALVAGRAMKRAMAQHRAAARLGREGKLRECYERIFRTVQRYVGDRFGLPGEGLTKMELEQRLRERGVSEELVQELAAVLDRCDAARFAPQSEAAERMEPTLDAVALLLRRLERVKRG